MSGIIYRLGLEQRVFPKYRKPFFELLARNCPQGFCLFAGETQPGEGILEAEVLKNGEWVVAENQYILRGKRYLFRQKNLLQWLESWKPQVLIAEANPRNLDLKCAIRWMHRHGGKVVGWGLGLGGGTRVLSFIRKGFRRSFVQSFDALISYSQTGKEEYIQTGFPPERIFVASNAVAPRPDWKMPSRPIHFTQGKPNVLFVGRLLSRKSVDHLIKACAKIPSKKQPNLTIVGDGPEKAALEKLASSVFPNTQFTGDLRGSQLENAYRQADLFVLPGTGGLAIQQAMSYALPVITGLGDGTQSDLVREQNGWQLETDTVEELADVLTAALKNAARLREMGKASFEIVKNEVNLEAMLASFFDAIDYVMKADTGKK